MSLENTHNTDCANAETIIEKSSELQRVFKEQGLEPNTLILPRPKDNRMKIGCVEITLPRPTHMEQIFRPGRTKTDIVILGMEVWIDDTLEENQAYVLDKNKKRFQNNIGDVA